MAGVKRLGRGEEPMARKRRNPKPGVAAGLALLVTAGLPGTGGATGANGQYDIVGYGSYPCSSLHEETEAGVGNWLAGYLTALNQTYDDTYDLKGGLDLDGVMDWIDDYCSKHPDDGIAKAAGTFVESHLSSRRTGP
jgi:hypothetical protein